jgi:hypothetical protein
MKYILIDQLTLPPLGTFAIFDLVLDTPLVPFERVKIYMKYEDLSMIIP